MVARRRLASAALALGTLAVISAAAIAPAALQGPILEMIGPGMDESFAFELLRIDPGRTAREPVVTVTANDVIWVAGSTGPDLLEANLWHGRADTAPPWTHVVPPSPGAGDATAFLASDGRLYWGVLEVTAEGRNLHLASGSLTAGESPVAWSPVTKLFDYDRPWFTSFGGSTFVAAKVAKEHLYKAFLGGQAWSGLSRVSDRPAGIAQTLSDGDIVMPLIGSPLQLAVSEDGGVTWEIEEIPMANDQFSLPWTAVDAGDNVYVVWGTNNGLVKYSARVAGVWKGPRLIGQDTRVWGASVVANETGKVDFAWFSQFQRQPFPAEPWTVRLRQVTEAHTDYPQNHPGGPQGFAVDPNAADGNLGAHDAFLDFLTIEKLGDGRAVIAYNCKLTPPSACGDDDDPHPVVAVQTGGPRI